MSIDSPLFISLQDLQSFIDQLPPPPAGFRRVFRGQNRDYGKMLPSGIRRPTREYWNLWQRHAMLVYPFEADLSRSKELGIPSTLDMLRFWVHAIAQHYGGDSNYLDVTHDIQSALWFALHEMVGRSVRIAMGAGSALDPERDVNVDMNFWEYRPWTEQSAWLYVFDVPAWDGHSSLGHGVLIDVMAQAPGLVSSSTRMATQRACLVHAQPQGGDLSQFYACTPLRVAWPMHAADRLRCATEVLFPPPTQDPWYATFLRQPLCLGPDSQGRLRFERPVPTAQYLPSGTNARNDLIGRLTMDDPPLTWISMRDQLSAGGAGTAVRRTFQDAAVILLEAALTALLPTTQGRNWNDRLLMEGLPTEAKVAFYGQPDAGLTLDLTNLVFEFSALEAIAIQNATGAAKVDYVRGLWLQRDGALLRIAPYIQTSGGGGLFLQSLTVERDAHHGLSLYGGTGQLPPNACAALMPAIHAALFILRCLTNGERILPFPLASLDPGLDEAFYVAGIDTAVTTLVRLPDQSFGTPVHIVRQQGEAFCGPGRETTRQFVVPGNGAFGDMAPAKLRRYAAIGMRAG